MAEPRYERPDQLPPEQRGSTMQAGGRSWSGCTIIAILLSLLAGGLIMLFLVLFFGRGLITAPAPAVTAPPTRAPLIIIPTAAPTPTPTILTGEAVIRQVWQVSRLETTTYSVQSVVTVERPGNIIGIGRQRLLVIVHGTVVAGIDLGKLRVEDITISQDGKRIMVRLPDAEILSSYLDESRTQLYDHQTGVFTRPDTNLVIEAQKAGASQVLRTACQDGIMTRATTDGQRAMSNILTIIGFERVEFEEQPVPECGSPRPITPTPGVVASATPTPAPRP